MKCINTFLLTISLIFFVRVADAQRNVFELFTKDIQLADKYYREANYPDALQLYQNSLRKSPSVEVRLQIARCFYFLKDYDETISNYNLCLEGKHTLPQADLYYYAEAQASLANYTSAIECYRKYLANAPDNDLVMKKIWRLSNIQYLYEDSMHFDVRPVSFNTEYGELCPAKYQDLLVFMSNRKRPQFIEKVDAASHASFYETYSTDIHSDTTLNSPVRYENIRHFDFESLSGLNIGPVIFYGNDQKMAFVASANEAGADGARTLQLYFSEKKGGKWSIPLPYKYNSLQYSISSPAISNDGKVLYFSSDMKGGLGGKDLYTSAFYHGEWSVPVNLGASVNTARDEEFPYLHQSKTLYFSSNGHAGIGGLDIFYTAILDSGFSEPENMGYPMNSSYDDFGIMLDSSGTRGYFSSNRKNGGYDDDVYKFKMDLQSYPVTIKGILKYKESRLNELSEARILAKAKIFLIDNDRHSTVYEGSSDDQGNFSVVVPYFSTYIVRVVGDDGREEDVVLEIPKFTSQLSDHEIVIIKNIF